MLREIVRPRTHRYTIEIPKEYINHEVEILVLPVPEAQVRPDEAKDVVNATAGILATRGVDPIEWQRRIRDEWERR